MTVFDAISSPIIPPIIHCRPFQARCPVGGATAVGNTVDPVFASPAAPSIHDAPETALYAIFCGFMRAYTQYLVLRAAAD